jgi:hypothetical protein
MRGHSLDLEAAKEKASHFISTAAEHTLYDVVYMYIVSRKREIVLE